MNFNRNNIPSELAFNASEPSSSQLGGAFNIDKKNTLSDNTWIYEWLDKWNIPKSASALGMDGHLKKQKSSPFNDGKSSITSPREITGKRGPPPEDIKTPSERQKRRRIDVAPGLEAGTTVSNGLAPTKRGPRMADLLPIQHDSWFYLPEVWEYRGPDGRRIRERRWSPGQDGDHPTTCESDRLHQNGDRNNATAATVATWVELNRLRGRYQELVAAFHSGPLVVHHLADRKSEEQLVAIAQGSIGVEKAMEGVDRAAPPRPRLSRPTAPPNITSQEVTRPTRAMLPQRPTPIFVSPLDTLLHVTPVEEASTQETTPAPNLATLPASLATPLLYDPLEQAAPSPAPVIPEAPIAAPSAGSSSTKGIKRRQKVTRIPIASTSSSAHSLVSTTGQFRFTAAGEALFKLLAGQGKYDEAFAMLPPEQQFEHLTAPDAIVEFRSTHPRPNKGGEGKKDETELWVCKAKVRLEKKELLRANKSDAPQYEFEVVYSDVPCNGTATTHDSKVRHKNRTHLGRSYQWNSTKQKA